MADEPSMIEIDEQKLEALAQAVCQFHANTGDKLVGDVWGCGDICYCTQAYIGTDPHDQRFWRGTFGCEQWGRAEAELALVRALLVHRDGWSDDNAVDLIVWEEPL